MGKCDREEIPRWLCHCCCSKCFESGFWSTFSPMQWKSYKQDRQVELTLGAELLVLSRAMAEAKRIRSLWSEAMNAKYTLETHVTKLTGACSAEAKGKRAHNVLNARTGSFWY